MYISYEDIKDLKINHEEIAENPGIFIEHNGRCFEPEEVNVDEDGDIIIRI